MTVAPSAGHRWRPGLTAVLARPICGTLVIALAVLGVSTPPAQAASERTTTASCVDGGGVTWHTKVVWGSTYLASTGFTKVSVDYAGWTTTLGAVATDSRVSSYDGAGHLVSSLTRTATTDYRQGIADDARNPGNPPSGGARIEITLGRDGDGFGNCVVNHLQSATADPVVAVVGDMACPPGSVVTPTTCQQLAVSNSILAAHPARLLTLGDNQYGEGTLAQYQGSYATSFGRLKAVTSQTPGNHEYRTAGAAGYFDYFGAAAGERSKGYYSHDIGSWHVVALNSEQDVSATGAEVAWLKSDLAAHPNRCTLAMMHRPRFSSGGEHGSDVTMKPIFDVLTAAHADLLLTGHDHDYERFARQNGSGIAASAGLTEIVSGSGGKSLYAFGYTAPNSVTRSNAGFGWLKLTLHAAAAETEFVGVAGNTFTDRSTISCQ